MLWLNLFCWLLKCVFSCNHLRTPVSEGKCYCPDCGRGILYQWVVIRCNACQSRRDSKTVFRKIIPKERHCLFCGESAFHCEYLESPAFFQLAKAWLVVQETSDYKAHSLKWEIYGWSLWILENSFVKHVEQTWAQTRAWMDPAQPSAHTLALLPISIKY